MWGVNALIHLHYSHYSKMEQLWIGLDRDWLAANTGRYVKFELKILNEYRDDMNIIIKYRRDIFCSNNTQRNTPTFILFEQR